MALRTLKLHPELNLLPCELSKKGESYRMIRHALIAATLLIFSAYPTQSLHANQATNAVHWCSSIPQLRNLSEAQFTATYLFDTDESGKPKNIKRIGGPGFFYQDGPMKECIASWQLPPSSTKGTASFRYKWAWIGFDVHVGSYSNSVELAKDSLNKAMNP